VTLAIAGRTRAGALVLEVDLEVEPGETVAVLGPNGAGKTTLLRALCGLTPLDDGRVSLDGRVLDEPSTSTFVPPERRSIGVVFQDLLLFRTMDVADNVAFGLRAAGRNRHLARADAVDWLERVGLADRATAAVADLSGGEAQRVALTRALAAEPRALLLDEPLAALDAEVRGAVRRQLRDHLEVHAGPCVLVTHDPLDAAVLADRVVVLEDGQVTDGGDLADLVSRPRTAWAAELGGTNLLPAVARGVHLELADGGEILVAEAPGDGPVLVAIRPAAVAVHRHRPEGSPRNVWEGTVRTIEGFGERVRVQVAGPVPLVAEVTGDAVTDLALGPGASVWLSVKATEVVAYPR
jgi:molybdate transport system ATP-binding protein